MPLPSKRTESTQSLKFESPTCGSSADVIGDIGLNIIGQIGVTENGEVNGDENGNLATTLEPEEGDVHEVKDGELNTLTYGLEETPPWYTCVMLGVQHYLLMFGASLPFPFLLATALCIENRLEIVNELISTVFFTIGIVTFFQVTFGVRLPMVQGASIIYATSCLAILNQDRFRCHPGEDELPFCNDTTIINMSQCVDPEKWKRALNELNGAVIAGSAVQIICGLTGLIGLLLKIIGPLTIAPMVTLVGLSLFEPAAAYASRHWWIALLTTALAIIFSLYMSNLSLPSCSYKRGFGCYRQSPGVFVFQMFPIILALVVVMIVCVILTYTDVLPNDRDAWGYAARSDARLDVVQDALWFRIPYPGQWGLPIFNISSVAGMLGAVFASILKAVGDYNVCSRACMVPPPPGHAVNRGIVIEGLGNILSGFLGGAIGTTTYNQNTGAIVLTKVASRRVLQCTAVMTVILALIGKMGAVFVTIPIPVIGGLFLFLAGIIAGFGLSSLQHAAMYSSRNIVILGFSLFFGISLPQWILKNGNHINTGVEIADRLFRVLFGSNMFVGGFVACFLDNTVPGTKRERGLDIWNLDADLPGQSNQGSSYHLPCGMSFINKWKWTKYTPICPTYQGFGCRRSKSNLEEPTRDSYNKDGVVNLVFNEAQIQDGNYLETTEM